VEVLMRAFIGGAVLLTAVMTGCTGFVNEHGLQRSSARVITPTPYPDSVKITEVHSSLGGDIQWIATLPSGVYDCSQESGERQPLCVKRPTPR